MGEKVKKELKMGKWWRKKNEVKKSNQKMKNICVEREIISKGIIFFSVENL